MARTRGGGGPLVGEQLSPLLSDNGINFAYPTLIGDQGRRNAPDWPAGRPRHTTRTCAGVGA